jgi:enoyl-CoA hydratase
VPLAIALELAMTGDPIDAPRALQLGLVNRVVPAGQVIDEAIALAERIGENSPVAVRNSRQLVREAAEMSEADGWRRTLELMMPVFESGDAIEGATAFAEKRPPIWHST